MKARLQGFTFVLRPAWTGEACKVEKVSITNSFQNVFLSVGMFLNRPILVESIQDPDIANPPSLLLPLVWLLDADDELVESLARQSKMSSTDFKCQDSQGLVTRSY